jgi:3-phosphoshikimate 1-carboxyvinyltransferase
VTSVVRIQPCGPTNASIRPPGSKSITNRAIVCAALAQGNSVLTGVLDSEDTAVMIQAWKSLGLRLNHAAEACELSISGCGGELPIKQAQISIGNSGTTIRFLTAALAACNGRFELDGVARMRQRPIGDLLDALNQLGSNVRSLNRDDQKCPPVLIEAHGLVGGRAIVAGNISSQFLSGLMMAAPLATSNVVLSVEGELVSVPYVVMTSKVMRAFGAKIEGDATGTLSVDISQRYVGTNFAIEPDASAASYFWGAAAVTGGRARVEGLTDKSVQGDVGFCKVLEQMGCKVIYSAQAIEIIGGELQGIDVDMADISDTVQTLAAVAMFAKGPTTVRGVAHNRVKETDRISDLAREIRKLGASVEEFDDGLHIDPPANIQAAEIETYQDHRMAMSLALVGLRVPGITIKDPDCTAKTYPNFWQDLESFSGCRIERVD